MLTRTDAVSLWLTFAGLEAHLSAFEELLHGHGHHVRGGVPDTKELTGVVFVGWESGVLPRNGAGRIRTSFSSVLVGDLRSSRR